MILIIPLLNHGRYEQLRFALRSITKHHDVTRCILVGGKPDWYTGEHLPHKDYGPVFKEHNIRDKTLTAARTFTGEFLFANDDHILLGPLVATYNKGSLLQSLQGRTGNGSYTRCLRNTLDKYGDVLNVDTHCPMFMNAELCDRTAFDWPEFGIGFKTCYAQEAQVHTVTMDDCKVSSLTEVPEGRLWFSLRDGFDVRQLLPLFPTKSQFER